jgi:DNA-binding transcriptional regulator YdaS (Cro superfamily)
MKNFNNAVEIIGGVADTARLLGVTYQAVVFWRDGLRRIPAEVCPVIERATNGEVPCESMRPDVDWAYLRNTKKRKAA